MLARLQFLLLDRPRLARRGVQTARSSFCDRASHLEGRNVVAPGARVIRSALGLGSYLAEGALLSETTVGRFCSLGPRLATVIGAHPTTGYASTHPAFFSTRAQAGFTFVQRDTFEELGRRLFDERYRIAIGSDVWIGQGAQILQGVQIGHGAVIAAGSVVTKDVPPYAIVAGVPARLLRFRFEEPLIERLLATAWWNRSFEEVGRLAPLFRDARELVRALESAGTQNLQPVLVTR